MTTNVPGQISLEGRLVSGVKFQVRQMTLEELPHGITWEDAASLTAGDFIEATVRIRVLPASGQEKIDLDNGAGTGGLTKVLNLQPIREGFKVTAILKAEDLEAAWARSHSA